MGEVTFPLHRGDLVLQAWGMAEAAAADETVITDHDLLLQIAVMALDDNVEGEEILDCMRNLGRGDLVAQARETKALMEIAEAALTTDAAPPEPPPPPPPEEKPADAP